MTENEKLARELRGCADQMAKAIADVRHMASSNATIHINAGGVGVWLAATCCLAMLAAGFVGGLWMVSDRAERAAELTEIRDQLRERRDGENAIRAYINTGILKPKAEKEKSDVR